MFLEPSSRSSGWFTNVFIIALHPITFISVDDSTSLFHGILVLGSLLMMNTLVNHPELLERGSRNISRPPPQYLTIIKPLARTSANTPTLQWLFHLPHGNNICQHINLQWLFHLPLDNNICHSIHLTVGGYITPKDILAITSAIKTPYEVNTSGINICHN